MSENDPENDNEFRISHPTRKGYLGWKSLDQLPPSLVNDLRNWVRDDGAAASKLAVLFSEYLAKKPAAPMGITYNDVSVITSKLKTIGVWKYVDIFDFVEALDESVSDEIKDVIELFAE